MTAVGNIVGIQAQEIAEVAEKYSTLSTSEMEVNFFSTCQISGQSIISSHAFILLFTLWICITHIIGHFSPLILDFYCLFCKQTCKYMSSSMTKELNNVSNEVIPE